MSRGFTRRPGARLNLSKIIVRGAIILSILALIIVSVVSITASTANQIMDRERKPLTNVPSNILPAYSPTSFKAFGEQTNLSGWFFKVDPKKFETPISTVILVHDIDSNRMQFGVDTVDLIESMLANGFNVFLFDLRNSGESDGEMTAFGYLEWQDVLGAIENVRKISVTTNVILYGIGNGCTAALMAMYKLPAEGDNIQSYPKKIQELKFNRSYITGVILDSPAKNSDDYIKPIVKRSSPLGVITQYTVPYAIRISAGEGSSFDLSSKISQLTVPVCILYGDHDTFIGSSRIAQIVSERERLHPTTTMSHVFSGAVYVGAFKTDSVTYIKTISDFLDANFYLVEDKEQ